MKLQKYSIYTDDMYGPRERVVYSTNNREVCYDPFKQHANFEVFEIATDIYREIEKWLKYMKNRELEFEQQKNAIEYNHYADLGELKTSYYIRNDKFKKYDSLNPLNFVEFFVFTDIKITHDENIEKYVLSYPPAGFLYAILILKKRWKSIEKYFKHFENEKLIIEYLDVAFKNHFPEDEIKKTSLFNVWHDLMIEKIFSKRDEEDLKYISKLKYFSPVTIQKIREKNMRYRYEFI